MWKALGVALALVALAAADTPANCSYEDMKGTWIFHETERTGDKSIKCKDNKDPEAAQVKLTLQQFNTVVDEFGNEGTWTIIYNQGFEARVNGRVYFTFLKWEESSGEVTSYCDQTQYGWSHDVTARNWACFQGKKTEEVDPKVHKKEKQLRSSSIYSTSDELIQKINSAQKSWKAKKYEMFEGKTHEQIIAMQGGRSSRLASRPQPAPVKPLTKKLRRTDPLPAAFDWRNVDGVNFVTPVRDQGECGSCYIFASMGMIGSRIRILTNNTKQPIMSPQEVISCSPYSQGCMGGFPYLIAGKYSQDYGLVEEECVPYEAKDTECAETKCPRHYVAGYTYVGGFYGACNEEEMKRSLVSNGPVVVGFEVYDDFRSYSGGVYHHTALQDEFNPIEPTNHSVLLVGYGTEEETGEDYWIVMNSWGEEWGDHGYFKIRRGTDECAIESQASEVFPIP